MSKHGRCASLAAAALLVLAACGGGAGGGDAGASPSPPSNLFVADSAFSAVGTIVNRNPGPGTLTIDRTIQGPDTQLPLPCSNCIRSMALDAVNDHLYVADGFLRVFHAAGTANGNVAASRLITPHNTAGTFRNAHFLHLDQAANTLYASDEYSGVNVFTGIKTAGAPNGGPGVPDVNAARTITTDLDINWRTFGLAVDTSRNKLYLAGNINGSLAAAIHVFDNQSALNGGPSTPNRSIGLGAMSALSIFLDATNDRLYVSNNNGQVLVFDNASTVSSPGAVPTKTLSLPFAGSDHLKLFVDVSADRLYAVGANQGFIVNGVSTLPAGGVPATAVTVSPSTVQLSAIVVRP